MENPLADLNAIYSEIEDAFQRRDIDGVAKYVAPDFSGLHGESQFTREQLLANVQGQFEDFEEISWPRTLSNARAEGGKLTVRAEGTYKAVKAGSGEPFQMELANDDTWQRKPEGWQLVFSTGLEAEHTVG